MKKHTRAVVKIKGDLTSGTYEVFRDIIYTEHTNDVGLCNMMIKLVKDNPSIIGVTSIQTMESGPYDPVAWLLK